MEKNNRDIQIGLEELEVILNNTGRLAPTRKERLTAHAIAFLIGSCTTLVAWTVVYAVKSVL